MTRDKVTKARAALILDEPFFGSLLLRLKLKEDPSCKTMWVDGKTLGYNSTFVDSLSMDKLKGCLCHEVMHLALSHHTRRRNRTSKRWNVAGDYAVNEIIRNKFVLPDGCLIDSKFFGQTVDAIYPQLPTEQEKDKNQDNESDSQSSSSGGSGAPGSSAADSKSKSESGDDPGGCGEVRDGNLGDGKAPSEADLARSEAEWKVNVSQAAQQAKTFGKLPAGFDRVVDEIINPKLNWRAILRQFMDTIVKSDYSWVHPNRRHIHSGLYLPSCRDSELGTIVIGVDTSGSISDKMLRDVAAEISSILNDIQVDCHVVYCDSKIQKTEHFIPGDLIMRLDAKGGGGTSFIPTFGWIESEHVSPSCVIYFTDLAGSFPETEPDYPVLWIVEGRTSRKAPFGEVLEFTGE